MKWLWAATLTGTAVLVSAGAAYSREASRATSAASGQPAVSWPLPPIRTEPEPAPTENLAQALDDAYRTAPALQAQRYQLRASDEDYALALSEYRPTSQLQVVGGYEKTVPGRTTQATRFASSPIITNNSLSAAVSVSQPLYTGGRATADREAALAEAGAGRAQLRGTEGDLLLQVITAYADVRRDTAVIRLIGAHVTQLESTFAEVKARREAGELTRTDIAQAETQLSLARAELNANTQQLEQDRATYTALVGHDPGVLAPPPPLPNVPRSVDEAFALADDLNPGLDQAIATERESRARISSARAEGRATLALNGSATLNGQAYPFYLHNEDQQFAGQAVLTIPLTNGGRVGALVAQARDKNAADRIGIELARRQMVDGIVNAWNGISATGRNIAVDEQGLTAARVFDDGTFQEYRAGLRSTFDVLFAQSTLLSAEVALVTAKHDFYVAQATLLREVGLLEARSLLTGTGLYDPQPTFAHAAHRAGTPLDAVVRTIDHIGAARPRQRGLEQPQLGEGTPAVALAGPPPPAAEPATVSPVVPLPGTVGTPIPDRSLRHP